MFVDNEDEVTSLYMMALAALGIVCPNSSFCWWGALLGAEGRRAVFPREWYAKEGVDASGIYFPGSTVLGADVIKAVQATGCEESVGGCADALRHVENSIAI